MRMFVAVVPPDEVLEDLAAFLEPRQDVDSGLRWAASEQWHLTLAFLPDVADRHLDELEERLTRAAARRGPLPMRIAGAGAFPDPARARVLYAAVEAADVSTRGELTRLAVGARAAATKSGAVVDGARFHPHVTLARLARPAEVTRWLRVLDSYRGPPWTAAEIVLIESHLGEGPHRRPRHETRATYRLG